MAAVLAAGCTKGGASTEKPAAPAPAPVPVAAAAPAAPVPAAPQPVVEASAPAAAVPQPPAPAPLRRRDPGRERRIALLIENAADRDPTGTVLADAEHAKAERAHCATQACIDRSYAQEEASLRQWEGSQEIH
jgi:hypothetical protein